LHAVQLPLEITLARPRADEVSASKKRLVDLLTGDLDYHNEPSDIASHNMHSFPAKYPPQLPRTFIEALTAPGNRVLDPMMGSGTTLVEAYLAGRQAVGFDIDPLAVTLARTKVTPLDAAAVHDIGAMILGRAQRAVSEQAAELDAEMQSRYDAASLRFIRYWFHAQTQLALYALIREIERIEDDALRSFFEIALSACIITKSGGVSLAFDLAHTRPHRAKIVYDEAGRVIVGEQRLGDDSPRVKLLT
jgi:SAM-dependent methyltransferase